jgi:hypothetical protein
MIMDGEKSEQEIEVNRALTQKVGTLCEAHPSMEGMQNVLDK